MDSLASSNNKRKVSRIEFIRGVPLHSFNYGHTSEGCYTPSINISDYTSSWGSAGAAALERDLL